VPAGTNEIPTAATLIERLDLANQTTVLRRAADRPDKKSDDLETEFLITSHPVAEWDAATLLQFDRHYRGIESGLHHRLDVSALEDKSRVRHPVAAVNLALFRRTAISFAVHWIRHQPNPRLATTTGFYDAMTANGHRKAFSLVTTRKPTWLPKL
jgi:predicted transposase YbfD/YdcC